MDLKNYLNFFDIKKNSSKIKRIFFYRICGAGMGTCACLFKENGFVVEGADKEFHPPMSGYLNKMEINCIPLDKLTDDYLKTFDLIIVGNVVSKKSEDARRIEQLGVAFSSFPGALGGLILDKLNVVGISGTHGKTTTAYLITQMFENMNTKPGYFIGGVIDGRSSARIGDGKYFFIESDEYDSAYFEKISKFRLYSIKHLICTSLEFDHADIFSSIEDIKDEFRELILNIKGKIIACDEYDAIRDLNEEFLYKTLPWIFYGNKERGPEIINENVLGTSFSLKWEDDFLKFETNLVGKHNIQNLSTCILFALSEGFSYKQIKKACQKLLMVKRRQEERGYYNNSLVIDDFAHHPKAVEYTIDAIKTRYQGKELLVIIAPQSATARSSIFQNEFTHSLKKADRVIVAKSSIGTTVKNTKDLDCQKIVNSLNEMNVPANLSANIDQLLLLINKFIKKNQVILVLSNGTCQGLWESDFASKLEMRPNDSI